MSATPDSTLANPAQLIADLQRQLTECRAARVEALAERDKAQRMLAERTAERDEALEQQTATAEVLQVINSSPGDLTPVFEAILDKSMHLCEAAFGDLYTFDGEQFKTAAVRGAPDAYVEARRKTPPNPHVAGTGSARILATKQPVHVLDVTAEQVHQIGAPSRLVVSELGGARTVLSVPLLQTAAVVGFIMVYRREVRAFTDKQIALLQNFAAQAVIAMENARLLGETRQRTTELQEALEYQTATSDVLKVISRSTFDLQPVLDTLCETAARLCGAASARIALQRDGSYRYLSSFATNSEGDAMVREMRFTAGRGTVTGRALLERQTVHVADIAADPEHDVPEAVTVLGIRTMLAVPLLREDEPIGVIALTRSEIDPFNERQIELVRTFADQAVIAIENARLITETREALEQQTATAEVLQVINSSPGDLAPVFDAMLDRALRLCDAAYGHFIRYDGELFHVVAVRGKPGIAGWQQRQARGFPSIRPEETGEGVPDLGATVTWGPEATPTYQRLLRGETVVHIPDVMDTDAYREGNPAARALVDLGGCRTVLAVALRKENTLAGLVSIYREGVRPFTEKEIALLENFAAQAVIAMENARLLGELRERTSDLEQSLEYQTATSDVLKVISRSTFDLQPVLDTVVHTAARLCQAERGHIVVRDGEVYRPLATFAVSPEHDAFIRTLVFKADGATVLGRTISERKVVHVADMQTEPAYASAPGVVGSYEGRTRTVLGVPLLRQGEPIGAIALGRQRVEPFTDRQIELVRTFADQAVIAMENARLLTETREALDQQTATAEVLQVINSSPGDLAPVFDAILEKAHALCGVTYGSFLIRHGGEFCVVAAHDEDSQRSGESSYIAVRQEQGRFRPPEGTPLWRVLNGERLVHLADAMADESYRHAPAYARVIDAGGIRTLLQVPLRKEDELLGVITAFRREVRPFSDKQIALLQNFAAQAVIAMESARLLDELRARTEEVAELNRGLEARVAEQVEELGRVGRLRRFLAPQLAELIVSQGDEKILESHRREIVVVFCDLRGYTAFTETAEPEEVLDFLREYHGALGPLVSQFEGTLDQFSGDGIMVFFNDPVPIPDPAERAVKMTMAMREAAAKLIAAWRLHGCELGFGAGIAQGYATLGQIGFSERSGYTAIGTVCNLAARLCGEAKDGQILVSSRIAEAVKAVARLEDLGNLELKGLRRPVAAFNVVQSTSPAEARPNLTVVARGPEA